MSTDISVESMRSTLLDLDTVRATLAASEPVQARTFSVGDQIRFRADQTFQHGLASKDPDEAVGMFVELHADNSDLHGQYQLTRSSFETVCTTVGFKKDYVADCPPDLLIPHLNYWFREGLTNHARKGKHFQFLIDDQLAARAFTKQGTTPFSNVALLDSTAQQIRDRIGPSTEILADYKLSHTLRKTTLRLVIPNACQIITGTGTPDDTWSLGIQISNSLTGQTQTKFEGYLFRWVCTNGQIDTRASSGAYTRRKDASPDEVYTWARQSVDDVLSGLEGALDAVQALTEIGIDGSISDTLRDVFEHYRIPLVHRPRIITMLEQLLAEHDGDISMYLIMNAITQVANDPTLDPNTVDALMRVGGDLPYTGTDRCGACHRILHAH